MPAAIVKGRVHIAKAVTVGVARVMGLAVACLVHHQEEHSSVGGSPRLAGGKRLAVFSHKIPRVLPAMEVDHTVAARVVRAVQPQIDLSYVSPQMLVNIAPFGEG